VHLTSRHGSVIAPVQASPEPAPGQAFMAMHWGGEYLGGRSSTGAPLAGVNTLTTPAFCPVSRQPELKHTPVKILRAELPWSLLAMAWLPEDQALAVREALRALMPSFAFAACVPFGRERTGVLLRAASYDIPPDELMTRIENLMGLCGADVLRYADRRRGQRRAARLVRSDADTRLDAFLLAGDTRAEAWIRAVLQDELPAQDYGRQLLAPGATAPVAVAPRSPQVCTCFNVGEAAIRTTLAACAGDEDQRLQALQDTLKCGTNCGSCIPALRRMARTASAVAA